MSATQTTPNAAWTNDYPATDGYYWWRPYSGALAEVALIWTDFAGVRQWFTHGQDDPDPLLTTHYGQWWSEPINRPTE